MPLVFGDAFYDIFLKRFTFVLMLLVDGGSILPFSVFKSSCQPASLTGGFSENRGVIAFFKV